MRAWEKNFRVVTPYVPGEQPQTTDVIKLNTNENPYPPSPAVLKAKVDFDVERLKLYPDYKAEKLVHNLAERYGLNENQVFAGVGSDDVLGMIFLSFFNNSELPILFPNITYSFYPVWADLYHIPYETQPLDENFRIRKEDYYKENGGVVIANPNAPTSLYENVDFIRDIVEHNQESVVVIDEAYIDFGGESALSLIHEFENLLIVQTFSKSRSLAGIRIGYAMGNERLIKQLNDVKYSYNSYTLNTTAIELGSVALNEQDYYDSINAKIMKTRAEAVRELAKRGFTSLDSKTNFLFTTHQEIPAQFIFTELKKHSIFVRYFNQPIISNYLRITIGTEDQMSELYKALDQVIESYHK